VPLRNKNKSEIKSKKTNSIMKKHFIFTVALSLFITVVANSQESAKKHVNMSEKRAERMADELGLSTAEKANVQALLEKQAKDYKEAKEKLSPKDANFKTKLEALHKKQEQELEKEIGKEKFAKYKENRKQEKMRFEAVRDQQQTTGNGQ
jgi:Skp family chaperone for outer membrane proteins